MNTEQLQLLFASRVKNVPPSFLREILKVASNPEVISFAGGLPNPAFFPVDELQACTQKILKEKGKAVLQYASTEGYHPLRQLIADRYEQRFGLKVAPEQILITNGSQQALDLISKLFINPGDDILLERPSYLGALQCFSMYQPTLHEVSLQEDGVATDELEEQLTKNNMKLFYCIPNYQNPTSIQYSLQKRQIASQLLASHPTIIIEDDPYGEVCFTGKQYPPLYQYLPEQTILLGSFSKTISPGLRVGWMVANEEIIRKATILKQASDLHSINLAQYLIYEFATSFNLDVHIDKIRTAYEQQKNVMFDCLERYFPPSVQYTQAKGGMFTWLTLPKEITARQLLKKAMDQNILFVPGDPFYASRPSSQTLRLNFSNVNEERMRQAMHQLGCMLC